MPDKLVQLGRQLLVAPQSLLRGEQHMTHVLQMGQEYQRLGEINILEEDLALEGLKDFSKSVVVIPTKDESYIFLFSKGTYLKSTVITSLKLPNEQLLKG